MTLALACLLAWAVLIAAVLVFFRSAARLNEGSDEHEDSAV
jgi:hypothetical protein